MFTSFKKLKINSQNKNIKTTKIIEILAFCFLFLKMIAHVHII